MKKKEKNYYRNKMIREIKETQTLKKKLDHMLNYKTKQKH